MKTSNYELAYFIYYNVFSERTSHPPTGKTSAGRAAGAPGPVHSRGIREKVI